MGLSTEFVDHHIAEWEGKLAAPSPFPFRAKWPSRLFHHAPIENAAAILNSGQLLSRNGSELVRIRDVAAADVVQSNDNAHDYARLYFRPRTPTQFHIEGVIKEAERRFPDAHSPTLVMFIFQARDILTRDAVCFSEENMQTGTQVLNSEAEFASIAFSDVYHHGVIRDRNAEIIKRRCAEVLVPSPMPIGETLQWIYCRSEAERSMLIHKLNDHGVHWAKKIQVSDDIKVFEKRNSFVENVWLSENSLKLRLHPRADGRNVKLRLTAINQDGEAHLNFNHDDIAPRPPSGKSWKFRDHLPSDTYNVCIHIDDCLAFEAIVATESDPF